MAGPGDTGAVLGPCIDVHEVAVTVAIIQVTVTQMGVRTQTGMELGVLMEIECK